MKLQVAARACAAPVIGVREKGILTFSAFMHTNGSGAGHYPAEGPKY